MKNLHTKHTNVGSTIQESPCYMIVIGKRRREEVEEAEVYSLHRHRLVHQLACTFPTALWKAQSLQLLHQSNRHWL